MSKSDEGEIALARESKTCRAVALLSTSHCGFANPPSKLLCTIKSWNWSCLTSARLRIGLLWPSGVPLRLTKRVDTDPIDAYLVSPQPTSHQQQLHKTKTLKMLSFFAGEMVPSSPIGASKLETHLKLPLVRHNFRCDLALSYSQNLRTFYAKIEPLFELYLCILK